MPRDTNFSFSFLALSPPKRAAILAVWDFCRAVDDEVDEGEERTPGQRREGLQRWRAEIAACFEGGPPSTPQGRALQPFIAAFNLPRLQFEHLVDGCEMDVESTRYPTFCDLRAYCHRVASTVGLICVEIFGYENPATRQYAEELGLALQLTNILRDVPDDLARGRLYLPLDELSAHGVSEDDLRRGHLTPPIRSLLERQASRARDRFARAEALLPAEDARAMVAARIMGAIYRQLLERIVARDYDVFSARVRVSTWRKAWIAAAVWLRTMAWPHSGHVLRPPNDPARRPRHWRGVCGSRGCDCTRRARRARPGARGSWTAGRPGDLVRPSRDRRTRRQRSARAARVLSRDAGLSAAGRRGEPGAVSAAVVLHVSRQGREGVDAGVPDAAPPFHLLAGLARWKALSWSDRWSASGLAAPLRAARRAVLDPREHLPCMEGESVQRWLVRHGQSPRLIEMLWEPLALAALNQPIGQAEARPFVRILGQIFTDDPSDAAIGVPSRPLDEVFGASARVYLEARGGQIRTDALARVVVAGDRVGYVDARGTSLRAGAVVLAVPWFGVGAALRGSEGGVLAPLVESEGRRRSSSIVSVNLWMERAALPASYVGLPGRTFHWIFDKRGVFDGTATHLTLVASGADAVLRQTNDELAALALDEATDAFPELKRARVQHVRVVRESNATFSLVHGQPPRPGPETPVRDLVLAGDWTDTGLPATIESAVLSGHLAAKVLR